MKRNLFYTTFDTSAGWMGLIGSPVGLVCVTLPQSSEREAIHLLGNLEGAVAMPKHFQGVIERFRSYFNGEIADFTDVLDLSVATPFQREVWQTARLIPYGETRNYAWVAARTGRPKAARAVGQALGINPYAPHVPCHRVTASDGSIGGYSGGLAKKKRLLRKEGVEI